MLQQYDSEVRARPKVRSGFEVERTGGVIRLTGHFDFICSWDRDPTGHYDGGLARLHRSVRGSVRSRGESAAGGLSSRLGDPDLAFYIALVSGKTVASARLELGSSDFGLLFGGGVSPGYRRQGLYRALVAARAEEAKRWGCSYLATDARETSRPILQNLGFTSAVRETTWVLPPQ